MLNGQTFSSRTGKTSGLPKFELLCGKKTEHILNQVKQGF